jgi:hypothetical protein
VDRGRGDDAGIRSAAHMALVKGFSTTKKRHYLHENTLRPTWTSPKNGLADLGPLQPLGLRH